MKWLVFWLTLTLATERDCDNEHDFFERGILSRWCVRALFNFEFFLFCFDFHKSIAIVDIVNDAFIIPLK
jgi:hypothetical protein